MKVSEPAKVTADCAAAKEALTDMPPRLESELDPVTLHNQAIMFADEDPTGERTWLLFLQLFNVNFELLSTYLLTISCHCRI